MSPQFKVVVHVSDPETSNDKRSPVIEATWPVKSNRGILVLNTSWRTFAGLEEPDHLSGTSFVESDASTILPGIRGTDAPPDSSGPPKLQALAWLNISTVDVDWMPDKAVEDALADCGLSGAGLETGAWLTQITSRERDLKLQVHGMFGDRPIEKLAARYFRPLVAMRALAVAGATARVKAPAAPPRRDIIRVVLERRAAGEWVGQLFIPTSVKSPKLLLGAGDLTKDLTLTVLRQTMLGLTEEAWGEVRLGPACGEATISAARPSRGSPMLLVVRADHEESHKDLDVSVCVQEA